MSEKAMKYGIEDLQMGQVLISPIDQTMEQRVKGNWDAVAKPLDSMGEFEKLLSRIGAIQNRECPELDRTALLVMCSDNGIVSEGVSQSPQSVTAMCAKNISAGKSSVGIMASFVGAKIVTVDIGMNTKDEIPNVRNRKIMEGTKNFYEEPAMTKEQALLGIQTGMDLVYEMKEQGICLVATGEMGIGNTTTSSAMVAALLDLSVSQVTGRGAGLTDEGLSRKQKVIEESLKKYGLTKDTDPLTVLSTVGGLDIAGLVGICIGGALYQVPVLLDGIISNVAALTAERMVPGVRDYLIPSHTSKEPAAIKIQETLGLKPVIQAGMALGEGTGAIMMLGMLKTASEVYKNSFTFDEYGLEQYQRQE